MVLSKKELLALMLALPEHLEELQLHDLIGFTGWASSAVDVRPYEARHIDEVIGRGLFATRDIPSNFCLGV